MINQCFIPYQQESLKQQLAETCNEEDLNAFALRVAAGEDPKSLPTYKPVSKIKLERPTRGQVIVWSRKVRAETFNTKEGRDLIKRRVQGDPRAIFLLRTEYGRLSAVIQGALWHSSGF